MMMTPAHKPPAQSDWAALERHWKTIAAAVALLGAAGYTVLSPGQKVDALSAETREWRAAQQVTDSMLSARVMSLEQRVDVEIREVRRSLDLLMLGECLQVRDVRLRAQLECRRRMDGSDR